MPFFGSAARSSDHLTSSAVIGAAVGELDALAQRQRVGQAVVGRPAIRWRGPAARPCRRRSAGTACRRGWSGSRCRRWRRSDRIEEQRVGIAGIDHLAAASPPRPVRPRPGGDDKQNSAPNQFIGISLCSVASRLQASCVIVQYNTIEASRNLSTCAREEEPPLSRCESRAIAGVSCRSAATCYRLRARTPRLDGHGASRRSCPARRPRRAAARPHRVWDRLRAADARATACPPCASMATQLGIAPMTVSHVYTELQEAGLHRGARRPGHLRQPRRRRFAGRSSRLCSAASTT